MLVRNPKKRINIEEVCSYFSFLEQTKEIEKKNGPKKEDDADAVSDVYDQFKEFIYLRTNLSQFLIFIEKNVKNIEKQC